MEAPGSSDQSGEQRAVVLQALGAQVAGLAAALHAPADQ